MYLNVYQFSLDLAGYSRTTTDTKKPTGLVPCGLSVLHRTYPDHDLVGWRSLNNSRNYLLLCDFIQFNFHWYT
ncbi:hypothetical protein EHE37_22535 [Salmonella enterica subsp. enterica serovar Napoli]|nr:hypothetical protein [Salmonella enterica subsp. enterica serovar Napoli]